MANNPVNFKIGITASNEQCIIGADFDDVFVRSDCFASGGLWLWGRNANGELGNRTNVNYSSPIQTVSGGTNWKEISLGYFHSVGIKDDGTLWSWGINADGSIGDGTAVSKSSPVQTVSGGADWRKISTGFEFTTAIKNDGTLWAWGYNYVGSLGDGTNLQRSSPVQSASKNTDWKTVSSGYRHSAALTLGGALWLWGSNNCGQLGDGTKIDKSSPVQVMTGGSNWKQVSAGGNVTAGIKNDGTLWLWGQGDIHQIGDSYDTSRVSPVQTFVGGTDWRQVSIGGNRSTAIKTDGTLWTWGYQTPPISIPTQIGDSTWRKVVAGADNTAVISPEGKLYIAGTTTLAACYGQLGNNTTTNCISLVETASGGSDWRTVSFGRYSVAAIRDNCW